MRQRANAVLVLGYSSTKTGAKVNDQRSWALVFLAGILNLRRQLLADCCSGAWRGYDKAAFPRQSGLRRASYSPFLQSSVQFWGFVGLESVVNLAVFVQSGRKSSISLENVCISRLIFTKVASVLQGF